MELRRKSEVRIWELGQKSQVLRIWELRLKSEANLKIRLISEARISEEKYKIRAGINFKSGYKRPELAENKS